MGKLLIIEDDPILRETLAEILEFWGHIVIQAENGEEGVKMFSESLPDLLICDINMPKMNGFQVLKKIKTLVSGSQLPPFMFLSAKTTPQNIKDGLDLGAVDFVSKPYSAVKLLKLIELRLKNK